jgi:hypothetical protein
MPVFSWFKKLQVIEHGILLHPGFSIQQCMDDENKKTIVDFMNAADLSIFDINIETRVLTEKDFPNDMPQSLKKELAEKKYQKVQFLHKIDKTNKAVWLPIDEESDGTRKLFAYAAPWLDLLRARAKISSTF